MSLSLSLFLSCHLVFVSSISFVTQVKKNSGRTSHDEPHGCPPLPSQPTYRLRLTLLIIGPGRKCDGLATALIQVLSHMLGDVLHVLELEPDMPDPAKRRVTVLPDLRLCNSESEEALGSCSGSALDKSPALPCDSLSSAIALPLVHPPD